MVRRIKEKYGDLHIGKDTFMILILVGILLFVIAWPVDNKNEKGEKQEQKIETSAESADYINDVLETKERMEQNSESIQEDDAVAVIAAGGEATNQEDTQGYAQKLEQRLEDILSVMKGVGKVKVMVTLQATSEEIIEKDQPTERSITTENDGDGGKRNINDMSSEETTVYITDGQGNQIPYVVKKLEPVVEGVTVVAQGGGNPVINKNITDIIQALFGIQPHKIIVVKMNS